MELHNQAVENKNSEKGFTLIEVIIATLILVVAILPLTSSFIVSQRMNVKGRQREQAMTVAQNVVETVKALGARTAYDLISNGTGSIFGTGTYSIDGTLDETVKSRAITVEGTSKTVSWKNYAFRFKIDRILMGQTYYDVEGTVTLDDTDAVNILAYSYADDYDVFDLKVMEYFYVEANVYPDGGGDKLATYSGSFVSKN